MNLTPTTILTTILGLLLIAAYVTQKLPTPAKFTIFLALFAIGYINGTIAAKKTRQLYDAYDIHNQAQFHTLPKRTTPNE